MLTRSTIPNITGQGVSGYAGKFGNRKTRGRFSCLARRFQLRLGFEDAIIKMMQSIIFFIQGREMRMPRQARRKSESGLHHVMVRGINQTQLFYDDEDRRAFMERLRRYKRECGFLLHAWCLMGNHVHLLVEEGRIDLSSMMKKILLKLFALLQQEIRSKGLSFPRSLQKQTDRGRRISPVRCSLHTQESARGGADDGVLDELRRVYGDAPTCRHRARARNA